VRLGDLSAEGRLLLACAVQGPDPAAVGTLLATDLDWPRLIERAVRHGLAPLLYATLRTTSPAVSTGPPDAILARLRELYDRHAARHTARVAKLAEIGAALDGAGIPIVVLKGAALGSAVYRDPAFRTMGDVDLLVHPGDLLRANRILCQLGYRSNEAWGSEAWYEAHHHHLAPLDAPDGSLIVELHRSIVMKGQARVPVEDLWARSRFEQIGGATFRVLAPTDLLLHLCLHLGHDNAFVGGKLRDLRDMAEAIRCYGDAIEWDAVVGRARAWRVGRHVYWALWLARDMVGAAVPAAVLEGLADARRDWLTDRLLRRILRGTMLRPEPGLFAMPYWLMETTIPMLMHSDGPGRTGAGLVYLLGRRLRMSARQACPAPAFLQALYLPVHSVYLIARAVGRARRGSRPAG
jgi:hypothetical protein